MEQGLIDAGAAVLNIEVPATLERALDPEWLTIALEPVGRGARVTRVEQVELLRTVATKVRFAVEFEGLDGTFNYCLKGLLDVDELTARGGSTMIREADFYTYIAPRVDVRVPTCVSAIVDRERQQGAIIMRDLIVDGARFCTALEPFTADEAAASLDQIARLHAGRFLLDEHDWITPRIGDLAQMQYVSVPLLQEMLDGPRGEGLPEATRNAERLGAAMKALAARDGERPQFLVHGDSHAGNNFRASGGGAGLIDWQLLQRGGWALDVGYHVCAVLPVDVAEREERALLRHYLATMRGLGCDVPDEEVAWLQYREAVVYGYYLWAITRRVDPPIINLFVNRLGSAVTRHDSHRLLGIA
jgi:phosphotransferase family enzyme